MSNTENLQVERESHPDVPQRVFVYIAASALLLQAAMGLAIYLLLDKWEDRAGFGEMFGAVNTLFSGLALAGVVYAILLQRQDLDIQRKELEMTREELRRSALAQEKSEQALVQQARMMELTAKLTALNFLAQAYKNRIELLEKQGREFQQERVKLNDIMHSLEALTDKMEE